MKRLLSIIIFTILLSCCNNANKGDFINNSIFINNEKKGFCIKNNKYYQYCKVNQLSEPHVAEYKETIDYQGVCFYTDNPIINVFSFSNPKVGDYAICQGSKHTVFQCNIDCNEYTVRLKLFGREDEKSISPVILIYKVSNNVITQFCFEECISNKIYRRVSVN